MSVRERGVCVGGGGVEWSRVLNALKLSVTKSLSLSFAESTNATMTSLSIVANLIAKSVLLVIVCLYKNNHTQQMEVNPIFVFVFTLNTNLITISR